MAAKFPTSLPEVKGSPKADESKERETTVNNLVEYWETPEATEMKSAGAHVPLLDHGYLRFIEHWGSDERIIESARMSTDKGFLGWGPKPEQCKVCNGVGHQGLITTCCGDPNPKCQHCRGTGKEPGDEKLLRFLHEAKHSTPFEMAGLTIEVKAPIMVFREWHRHRVPFGYNELSARYVPLPDENYCPTVVRIIEGALSAGKNKQAQGTVNRIPTEAETQAWLDRLVQSYDLAQAVYEEGLAIGVPKELARCPVPVARYSRMRATGNLRGWLGFMTLRSAPAAQWEIRQFSNAIGGFIQRLFPRTYELFAEGQL